MTKAEARALACRGLHEAGAARSPFPTEVRIPNFVGAEAAARRLRVTPACQWARTVANSQTCGEMPVLAEVPWESRTVPDLLHPGLRVVFVGLNPGRASATAGHHFAGPGNHFWRLLHESGLTPRRLDPAEDEHLLAMGLGITNAVPRSSRGEQDLAWEEFLAGAEALRQKVANCQPGVVALLGKMAYRAYAGLSRTADVAWGRQDRHTVPGVAEYLAANPSSRSTVPFAVRLAQFQEIRRLAE
ncbi:MAG TPA: mismatch-specific DNA-glycosylase [Bacillota bacterium]|nr:mismatch-specific DNA-glycosylase [Bacillota bacterium]